MAQLQPGDPELIGRFKLLERLGTGGMGRVYLAHSPGGMRVAVKVIHSHLAEDQNFRARFKREVSAARLVSGAFTAPVVAADLDGQQPWVASAYVPGPSLASVVSQHGPLDLPTVAALAAGLAEGLNAVHEAGVIHRDLTPANVLLSPDGPRIIDFGISAAAGATALTGTGMAMGTPAFMSPEQALAQGIGQASDIFSLGSVLTYAARGEGPFGRGDYPALLFRIVQDTPDLDGVSAEFRPLLMHCLNREPDRRPTALAFLTEVTAAFPAASTPVDWRTVIAAPRSVQHQEAQPRKPQAPVTEPASTPESSQVPSPVPSAPVPSPVPAPAPAVLPTATDVPAPATQTLFAPRAPGAISVPPPGLAPSAQPHPEGSRRRRRLLWLGSTAAVLAAVAIIAPLTLARSSSSNHGPAFFWYRPGECLKGNFLYVDGASWPAGTKVPCATEHDAEVYYANFRYWPAGSPYPGSSTVKDTAVQECIRALDAYHGAANSTGTYAYAPLGPDISSWSTGQRYIVCVAYELEGVHGSIKGTSH